MPGVRPELERSARFWLRAYPRRWRRVHADEVVGVLAELAGPGARRVDVRTAFDLLRSGWGTRWRGHPGLGAWLGYRFGDLQLPARFRTWAADDIDGRWFFERRAILAWVLFATQLGNGFFEPERRSWSIGTVLFLATFLVLQHTFWARWSRRQARERHLVAQPGEPLLPGTWVATSGPQIRVPARWAVRRLLAATGVLGAAAVAATLLASSVLIFAPVADGSGVGMDPGPIGAWRWLAGGLLVSAAVGGLLRARRLHLRVPARLLALPDQPNREVEPQTRRAEVAVVTGTAAALAVTVGEATGVLTLTLGPAIGAVALVVLARTVVLALAGRELGWEAPDGSELAWCDLSASAALRPVVPVDPPVRVVRRWDGPYVPGQVVLGPMPLPDPPYPPLAA